jgi:hypothetical protein
MGVRLWEREHQLLRDVFTLITSEPLRDDICSSTGAATFKSDAWRHAGWRTTCGVDAATGATNPCVNGTCSRVQFYFSYLRYLYLTTGERGRLQVCVAF